MEIGLLNKVPATDVLKAPDGSIAHDFLLNVESVEIDDIDLGPLRHSESVYELAKKEFYQGEIVSRLTNCVNLGFNGTYVIQFKVPFYLWLLERL